MINLYKEYRKKKRLDEIRLIHNKIKSCKKNNIQNTRCRKQLRNYNCNIPSTNKTIMDNPLMTIFTKREYILNEYRKGYRNLNINSKQKQWCIVYNDYSRKLLFMKKNNIEIFISYSKLYGVYLYLRFLGVDLFEEVKDPDMILSKKMEELQNVNSELQNVNSELKNINSEIKTFNLELETLNLELEEKQKELLNYIKIIQSGLHFIGRGEEETISCSRLDFMSI